MTSRQYKHQQDRLQKGWSKVHVMLDPETTRDMDDLSKRFNLSKTHIMTSALKAYMDKPK